MEIPWIVSVRGGRAPDDGFRTLQTRIAGLADTFPITLPPLKVGTLNTLLEIADSLGKIDQFSELVCHRIEKQLYELQKNEDAPMVKQAPVEQSLFQFQWDEGKYVSARLSIPQIVESISTEMSKIDEDMKARVAEFSATKSALTALNRRSSGSLAVRSLADMVTLDDVVESENLTTLFVVVPKFLYKDWAAKYESLAQFVVPRSSRCICEDEEAGLFAVTLFKRVVAQFKTAAQQARFTVREFSFDPAALQNNKEEKKKLDALFSKQWADFLRWCRTAFAEAVLAWFHLKVVRCHAESVLRYGLPVDYRAVVVVPHRKQSKHLMDVLVREYSAEAGGPATAAAAAAAQAQAPEGGKAAALVSTEPYLPFVYFTVPFMSRMIETDH
ncbi:putative V-type proton ATPase subunit C 1-A [Paratrimastix pyriformis]|uniref:V-type proton ATPase subunit C n=1 Tax=Paratrimastix pyriformis TaxID=342808 RepID=A0ABQ8USQ3_9EUKA|nr:putative V-type proton ATPase subunit C 1-A [Paratrimastix pyriformis]|eukprot:GAFH01001635.1.p1 GENE.GAFH01001635.1~~GAFH01001635.1.p1  ORF type:complete len:406 (-),score=127.89 GAFH01001635.1:295-1452(-)